MSADTFRPRKLDIEDREVFMTLNSEMAFRAVNVAGLPQLIGRARIGTSETDSKWQLMQLIYDASNSITSIKWPIGSNGTPTSAYAFPWGPTAAATITDIQTGTTTTITATNTFTNGDLVYFLNIQGTTGLNFTGSNLYTVSNATTSAFQINCDSSQMAEYTSGGNAYQSAAYQNGFV